MSLTFSDSDSDASSDCESEYLSYCQENKTELSFIVQQTLMLTRLKKLEDMILHPSNVMDNYSYTLERIIDGLILCNKK
jgi:hypothetical protein